MPRAQRDSLRLIAEMGKPPPM